MDRRRKLQLGALVFVAALILLANTWPPMMNDFRACARDQDCVLAPGCHPLAVAARRREAWTSYVVDCHCGPCKFAVGHIHAFEAWGAWIAQGFAQRRLCPENPATASIVCERVDGVACAQSGQCVIVVHDTDELRPAHR